MLAEKQDKWEKNKKESVDRIDELTRVQKNGELKCDQSENSSELDF